MDKPQTVSHLKEGDRFRVGRNCYTLVRLCSSSALVRQIREDKLVKIGNREFTARSGKERHISLGTIVDEVLRG